MYTRKIKNNFSSIYYSLLLVSLTFLFATQCEKKQRNQLIESKDIDTKDWEEIPTDTKKEIDDYITRAEEALSYEKCKMCEVAKSLIEELYDQVTEKSESIESKIRKVASKDSLLKGIDEYDYKTQEIAILRQEIEASEKQLSTLFSIGEKYLRKKQKAMKQKANKLEKRVLPGKVLFF